MTREMQPINGSFKPGGGLPLDEVQRTIRRRNAERQVDGGGEYGVIDNATGVEVIYKFPPALLQEEVEISEVDNID